MTTFSRKLILRCMDMCQVPFFALSLLPSALHSHSSFLCTVILLTARLHTHTVLLCRTRVLQDFTRTSFNFPISSFTILPRSFSSPAMRVSGNYITAVNLFLCTWELSHTPFTLSRLLPHLLSHSFYYPFVLT